MKVRRDAGQPATVAPGATPAKEEHQLQRPLDGKYREELPLPLGLINRTAT